MGRSSPSFVLGALSPRRKVLKYQIQKFRDPAQQRDGAVGGEPRYPAWFEEDFQALVVLLRRGEIHPVVAERLPLAEARHAHEILDSSAAKGKLVLVPGADRTATAPREFGQARQATHTATE